MRSPHRFAGPALLILVAVLWSLGGVLIKSVEWHPIAISAVRSAIAVPVVLLCAGLPRKGFTPLQWGGAAAYTVTVLSFVIATRLTTAANAIFLQYTAPIYVALLAPWLLGERARRSDWAVIAVALGGIALFFLDQLSPRGLWGNVFALVSGFSFAVMTLLLRKEREGQPMQVVLLGNILTALVGLPVILNVGLPDPSAWGPLILLGLVQLGLGYVLYTIAIRRVTALGATLLTMLEPVLNPLWVMLAMGEQPGRWATVGGTLVLFAVLTRAALSGRNYRPNPPVAAHGGVT
jgi:drug/metabolite transporter (DMT)-like permease